MQIKYSSIFLFFSLISAVRGFFAFVLIPVFWFISDPGGVLSSFWWKYFVKKGVPIFSAEVFIQCFIVLVTFCLTFSIFIFIQKKYDLSNKVLEFRAMDVNPILVLFSTLLLAKKISVIYFDQNYFNHSFWEGAGIYLYSQKVFVHLFLPNILMYLVYTILLMHSSKFLNVIGFILSLVSIYCTIQYGSRFLFISLILLFIVVLFCRLNIKIFVIMSFVLMVFVIPSIILFAYDGGVVSRFYGLLMRLDVYHVISHINYFDLQVDINGLSNQSARNIGLIALNDFSTGVGVPYFTGRGYMFAIFFGFIFGLLLSLGYLFSFVGRIGLGLFVWYFVHFSFLWVELSIINIINLLLNGLLCVIVLFIWKLVYTHFSRFS